VLTGRPGFLVPFFKGSKGPACLIELMFSAQFVGGTEFSVQFPIALLKISSHVYTRIVKK
jgi:hypothetical protein